MKTIAGSGILRKSLRPVRASYANLRLERFAAQSVIDGAGQPKLFHSPCFKIL